MSCRKKHGSEGWRGGLQATEADTGRKSDGAHCHQLQAAAGEAAAARGEAAAAAGEATAAGGEAAAPAGEAAAAGGEAAAAAQTGRH